MIRILNHFFFNDTATTEIYTLSLHDALPISDTMTLSVTPGNITFSVQITSVNPSGYQFGTVNLGATTISTRSVDHKYALDSRLSDDFRLMLGNSAPDGWTPQAGAPGTDQFRF